MKQHRESPKTHKNVPGLSALTENKMHKTRKQSAESTKAFKKERSGCENMRF